MKAKMMRIMNLNDTGIQAITFTTKLTTIMSGFYPSFITFETRF